MPPRRRPSPVLDDDHVDEPPKDAGRAADVADALALAEAAEAEAAEAEAVAAAARARARAIRLRRQAGAVEADSSDVADVEAETVETAEAAEIADSATDTATVPGEDSAVDEAVEESDIDDIDVEAQAAPEVSWKLQSGRGGDGCVGRDGSPSQSARPSSLSARCWRRAATWCGTTNKWYASSSKPRSSRPRPVKVSCPLMSLDFKKAKEDVERIIDNSTGQFKDDFEAQAPEFTKVAESSKVITEADVNATGVESMTDDTAVVLVAVTSHITNAAGAKQDPRTWRLSVDMARDGDRIKMSKVEFVP